MTLTGIGADSPTGRRGHVTITRRLLAVVTMLTGGILGAWLVLNVGVVASLALATALLAIIAACAAIASRNPGEWRPVVAAKPAQPAQSAQPAQDNPKNS
jgi:hypothetical protein